MVEIQLVTVSCVFKCAKLVNCSFNDNLGTALTVHNTNVVLVETKFLYNQCACRSFSEIRELGCGITTFNSKLKSTGNQSFIYWFIVCLINRNQCWSCTHRDWQSLVELIIRHNSLNLVHTNIRFFLSSNSSYWVSCTAPLNPWRHKVGGAGLPRALRNWDRPRPRLRFPKPLRRLQWPPRRPPPLAVRLHCFCCSVKLRKPSSERKNERSSHLIELSVMVSSLCCC